MFEVEQFVAECRAAAAQDRSHASVREVVARAVSDPAGVVKALGEPARAQIQRLYQSSELTVLNVIWAPKMTLFPHNHQMWAVIGIYSGREDNIFWRRLPNENHWVEAAGAKSLSERPIPRLTGAIHVYGGDFFNANRSEWDPESLLERPCDPEQIARTFEAENARLVLP